MRSTFIITLSLLVTSLITNAQTTVQNTGRIHISGSSDILYVNYPITNSSSATLTNNGQLHIIQNLTNNEAMTVGTGTLYLSGTSSQSIDGTQAFKTNHLVTSNSSGIVLNNNLIVYGTHTFSSGIISTSATPNYLVYEAGSSYSGSGDSRHVNGWVKKIGNTTFAFPVGNGTVERPVTIQNLSASSEFNARHNLTTPNKTSVLSPITDVDGSEYWTINRISGGTAQIFMNWNTAKISFPHYVLADIRAVYYNGTQWANQGGSATGNSTTTGTITSNAMSSFGNFAIGSISAVLPVHFVSIWGDAENSDNIVHWRTADEWQILTYEIQRSSDGVTFSTIGEQSPENTDGLHEYSFKDAYSASNTAWYRVRNIDRDGKFSYSAIIKLSSASAGSSMRVLNNIVSGAIYVEVPQSATGDYRYQLMTTSGQAIVEGTFQAQQAGRISLSVSSAITKGMYILHIFNQANQLQERVYIR